MLRAFRSFTKSRFGLIAVFVVLGIIALAFAAGDVTGLRAVSTAGSGDVIATVGNQKITDREVRERIDRLIANLRRNGQQVSIEGFLASGDYEAVIEELINNAALVEFARKNGMTVSAALVDGEIASIPNFQGVDGKFDQKKFESLLADQRLPVKMFRDDFSRARYGAWLINPIVSASQVPDRLVAPYASLLLERRRGIGGIVRTIDMDPGPDPDNKTLAAFYAANRGRYMIPERRVIRYAVVKADDIKARSAPTDAEIADAYKKSGTRYTATEKRSARQLVLTDQAAANKAVAEIKGGKSIEEQAKAVGLEAARFDALEKPALARETSAPIADAVFAAAQGGVVGPIRSPLGWVVLHLDKVEKIAARSLEQARTELVAELTQRKTIAALGDLRQKIEDGIGDGATFDELMKIANLAPLSVGPIAANGTNPLDPGVKLDPAMQPIVQAGFATQPDDDQQVVAVGKDGSFAVVAPQQITAAAPRPLAEIRKAVNGDYLADQALKKARTATLDIVKQINSGVPIQQAMAAHGATKVPLKPFDLARADLEGQQQIAPQVMMAFSMAPKKAKFVAAPNRQGFLVIYLDSIEEHDASGNAELMAKMRANLLRGVAQEHALQFMEAVRRDVKVKRDDAVIARLKAAYAGASSRSGS